MALVKISTTKILYLAAALFLVLAIMSSTLPSCRAGGCVGCHRSPPPPVDDTCFRLFRCTPEMCSNECRQRRLQAEGAYCVNRNAAKECCCRHDAI
ncbi:hypothetical protein ACP4OV_025464 [Aristida adscensionis]